MRTKLFLTAAIVLAGLFQMCATAQTAGTLTFSVTTSSSGGFSPKNIVAIWVQDGTNAFVKTKLKYAATQENRLLLWKAVSGGNVVDAVTGATQSSHATRSIVWNGTNVAGSLVADGNYSIWVELSWGNNSSTQKASTSVSFTKGATVVHLTPASTANFSGITLDWTPEGIGLDEGPGTVKLFGVYPNPVTSSSAICYQLGALTDVTISIFDGNGRRISLPVDANQDAGTYRVPLHSAGVMKPGIYFVQMYTGQHRQVTRIVVP